MRSFYTLLLVVLILPLTSYQTIAASAENKQQEAPAGWVQASQSSNDIFSLIEYVPEGETYQKWSEMISLIQFNSGGKELIPDFIKRTIITLERDCNTEIRQESRLFVIQEKRSGVLMEAACDDMKSTNKTTGALVYKNELMRTFYAENPNGLFIFQYAWHHNENSAKNQLDNQLQKEFFEDILKNVATRFY